MIDLFGFLFKYFERPYVFLLVIPITFIWIYLLRKNFVKLYLGEEHEKKRKKLKIFIFISRAVIVLLLLVAFASPYIETTKVVKGDPKVTILVDNSTSIELFDFSFINSFRTELEKKIPVEFSFIASGEESRLGDGIISNIKKDSNILLISDGNNNAGIELGDVVVQANSLNASISALRIFSDKYDSSVVVYGSDKTTAGSENTFTVVVKQTEKRKPRLIVHVDATVVLDQLVDREEITFKNSFDEGYHEITAKLEVDDYFKQNNIFYKTVKVVPKPKVLLLSKNEELVQLFEPLYNLDKVENLGVDLKPYTAVFIDDIHADELNPYYDKLSSFVSEGSGLFVLGGRNSYDSGNYNGSKFEQLLPAFVAKSGKKRGDINIILLIDVSGSTGIGFGGYKKVDVEKALAISMLSNLSLVHRVGVVAFSGFAYKLAELKALLEQGNDLYDKIGRLQFGGGTDIEVGMKAAIDLLHGAGGSKNIIILSDGNTQGKEKALNAVKYAASQGINTYTVGVGGDTDRAFMQVLADEGNGIYFEPDTSQKIKLLFGETEVSESKRVFAVVSIDKNHFITKGLDLSANVYGFNQVVPKTTAKILVTTDLGESLVLSWRYGLGRVASLATDYKVYGFELLNKKNSLLLTRIGNWVIGDPERKNSRFIDVSDGEIGKPIEIIVKSDVQPSSKEVALYKFDENLYRGKVSINKLGFSKVMDAVFAVNYKSEYIDIGTNQNLNNLVYSTGGMVFDPGNIGGIVDFIKQRSRREILVNKSYSWIFLLSTLLLYLVEVCIRRLVVHKVI
ncbi:VWA domain-containing protein [Candidatus Woesearchaeota archaeon]|nr:VWA domain-containing protein [Candidatus Woesearchaeota archaeon]